MRNGECGMGTSELRASMNRKAISSFNVKSKATGHTKANDKQPKKIKKKSQK